MPDGTFVPTGKHLVAGKWIGGTVHFSSSPVHGPGSEFASGTGAEVDTACRAAAEAFLTFGVTSRASRANFLASIADEIEARGDAITAICAAETGLPEARLRSERGRTTGQLRLFAEHIRDGSYLDRRHARALPERAPLPRPDLRVMQKPIGPVAVFGASNFPLAFSTAGGDTASALAAGCPVVVKGHPAHPGTGEIVAHAIDVAIRREGLPPGVFSLIQGDSNEVGAALVQHPVIAAVGFTGSFSGGRALFDLCAQRDTPIPFYGEMGSVNPVFLLPEALGARAPEIAKGWADSLTMGGGQFCTKPGVAFVPEGVAGDAFVNGAREALAAKDAQTLLTNGIAEAYHAGRDRMAAMPGVHTLVASSAERRSAAPDLFETTAETWLETPELAEEIFGPFGLVVRVRDDHDLRRVAEALEGQLTCTLHIEEGDTPLASGLMTILERKAGRVLANGFPTGVEVSDAMVHGGPYPATTNFGATSVGTLAIRRFLRPVCYQDMPEDLLPTDLREGTAQ